MKKCPICQKEFPDSMRFCQTDGTPLPDPIEDVKPEDPLKTMVVRQEDIASSIPASDPFKTMVASSGNKDESGDLLQLPEEFDPMKTMVAAPNVGLEKPILEEPKPESPKFESIKEEIKSETPSSSFSGFSQPSEPLPEPLPDYSDDPTVLQPEPPKFSQPNLSAPNFGNLSPKDDAEDDLPATMIQNSWDAPKSDSSPFSNNSPFAKPNNEPIPTPFDVPSLNETKLTADEPPSSPFGQNSQSSFDEPKSQFDGQPSHLKAPPSSFFDMEKPSFQEPPPATEMGGVKLPFEAINNPPPYENPPAFGNQSPFDNQQSFGNQPLQQTEWTPPPTPVPGWQDQGLGANTPFQPPVAMQGQGQNQSLAIASIVCGVASLILLVAGIIPFIGIICGIVSLGTAVAAIITGFLARGKAKNFPEQYTGGGLALGGIITGALSILAIIGLFILTVVILGISLSGAAR